MKRQAPRIGPRLVRQIAGACLAIIGITLTLVLAVVSSQDQPPPAAMQGLLALSGIVAQLGSAWAFNGVGKPDPALAERAVSRLFRAAMRAKGINRDVEGLFESKSDHRATGDDHARLGQVSVMTGVLAEEIVEAIEDWNTFAPAAVSKTGALESRPVSLQSREGELGE